MNRNECIHLRVSAAEKRQIAAAAQQAGQTVADYLRTVAVDRISTAEQADRLLVGIIAAMDDQVERVRECMEAISQRTCTLASKEDLRKLAEWISAQLESERSRS